MFENKPVTYNFEVPKSYTTLALNVLVKLIVLVYLEVFYVRLWIQQNPLSVLS